MSPNTLQKSFHELAKALLEKQLMVTERLHVLLQKEYDILHMRNIDSLDVVASEKHPIVIDIDTLNQHWISLLELEGAKIDVNGIITFLKDYDDKKSTAIFPLWENVLVKAKECHRLNTINGATLTLRNQATQQAMSILRGHTPGDSLYNLQGSEMPNYAGGKSIAKA